MKKPQFVENQIYHVYNRGVEKRATFLDDKDFRRFIHDLFEFNDKDSAFNVAYYFNSRSKKIEPRNIEKKRKPRKSLVEILLFVLMPNHFHLLLKQSKENGIVKFMQKLGTGYTNYFNKKYERGGGLFQGRFKAVLIGREAQYIHVPSYIHLNPLELLSYRGSTSIGMREKMEFLENYQWSSYPDYIGKKNFPSLTSRDLYLKFFGGEGGYKEEIERLFKT